MNQSSILSQRRWVVGWMYAAAVAHFLAGAALLWVTDASVLDGYHRGIERHFWAGLAPAAARAQQTWWMALFGATLQCSAIWMLALVHLGNQTRHRAACRRAVQLDAARRAQCVASHCQQKAKHEKDGDSDQPCKQFAQGHGWI